MKILVLLVVLIVVAIVVLIPKNSPIQDNLDSISTPKVTSHTQTIQAPFTATFEIYTNGTKRIFTDPKYHNLSTDVFISPDNPSVINVQVSGTTWDEFFKTLPMQLSKDCLVTGTQQTFCSNEQSTLKFFVNNIEDKDILDKQIMPNDHLEVTYSPSS